MIRALHAANEVAAEAKASGRHPFGAVLIAPDGGSLASGNLDTVRHAETELARTAAARYERIFSGTVRATNFEPCAMCTGTIYWPNIGRTSTACASRPSELTGAHEENPTLACRESIVAAGRSRSL